MNYLQKLVFLCEKLRFLLLGAILFLIPFVIDAHIQMGSGPDTKFRFFEYLVILAWFFTIPSVLRSRTIGFFKPLQFSILLFSGYLIFRALIDPNREFALDNAFQSGCWLLFSLLIADACRTLEDFKKLLCIGVIAQIPVLIYAFGEIFNIDIYFDYILRKPWRWENELMSAERSLIYALSNPNFFASYASMLLIWTGVLFCLIRNTGFRFFLAVYSGVLLYSLVYTFTRGIWISLFASVFIVFTPMLISRTGWQKALYPLLSFSKKWVLIFLVILVGCGAALHFHSIQGKSPITIVMKRFEDGFGLRDSSLRTRPLLWYTALQMWKTHLVLGSGHGQYGVQFVETVYALTKKSDAAQIQEITKNMNTLSVQKTHNDFLQYLAETGAVGYGLFLLILVLACWTGAVRFSQLDGQEEKILVCGSLLIVVFIIFQCMHDFPLRLPASSIWFSMALGVILLIDEEPRRLSGKIWIQRTAGLCIAISILAGTGWSGWMVARHLVASHLQWSAEQQKDKGTVNDTFQRKSELRMAEENFRKADTLFPGDGITLSGFGQTYYLLCGYVEPSLKQEYRNRAIRYLEQARNTFTNPMFYHLLGVLYLDMGQTAKASQAAEIVRLIDPKRKDAQLLAGRVALAAGRVDDAVAFFQQEIFNNPGNIDSYAYLGSVYENNLKEFDKAVQTYSQLLQINPNVPDCHERLANLYDACMNQPEQALEHFQIVLDYAKKQMQPADRIKNLEKRMQGLKEKINLKKSKESGK